jgi:hypothetical protein
MFSRSGRPAQRDAIDYTPRSPAGPRLLPPERQRDATVAQSARDVDRDGPRVGRTAKAYAEADVDVQPSVAGGRSPRARGVDEHHSIETHQRTRHKRTCRIDAGVRETLTENVAGHYAVLEQRMRAKLRLACVT